MSQRLSHLLLLLAAFLSPLCCCKIGGWEALVEMARPAARTADSCPLCHPESRPAPRPESPCEQCPSCKGSTGTIPDAPAALHIGAPWDVLIAILTPRDWTLPERVRSVALREAPRAVFRGGRDLLRLHCALLI